MPDDQTDVSASPPASSVLDLYCLQCGYNLRGLSGDPRRCPECGYLNPLGDLEIPAPFIKAQFRRMESAPAFAAAALLVGLPCVFVILTGLIRVGAPDPIAFVCPFVALMAAIAVWLSGIAQFRDSCQSRPGWFSLFLEYQVYALLLCFIVGGMVLVSLSVGKRHEYVLPAFVAALAFIFVGGRWAHKRLRSKMEPMQREMAVRIARDELRRKMANPNRGMPFGLE